MEVTMTEYRPIDQTVPEYERSEMQRVAREEQVRMKRQKGRKALMTGVFAVIVLGAGALFLLSERNQTEDLETAAIEQPQFPDLSPWPQPLTPEVPDPASKAAPADPGQSAAPDLRVAPPIPSP
jgi:hypothetical protein